MHSSAVGLRFMGIRLPTGVAAGCFKFHFGTVRWALELQARFGAFPLSKRHGL